MKRLSYIRLIIGIAILITAMSNGAAPTSAQTGPSYGSGLTSTGLTLNGGAAVNGTRLRMTDGGSDEARSAFFSTPVTVTNFTNTFTFQDTNASADGLCFVIEANGPTALGEGGGNLGYAGPSGALGNKSLCVGFDLYNNSASAEISNTGLFTNGASAANGAGSSTGLSFQSGDPFNVTMNYNGTTLAMQITDTVTNATFSTSFTVDIPSIVGGNTAYVGFTGGDWRLTATQDILAWTYTPMVTSGQTGPSYPSYGSGFTSTGLSLNGGAAVNATRLRMTDGGSEEARSAFFSTPVAVTSFTNTFTFQDTDASADGLCFVIEASGPTALGNGGGDLGYGGTSGALGNKSLCVAFDLYNHNSANREISNTGLFTNGASAANGAGSSTGLSFQSGDLFSVTMNYNGTTLAMQITDTVTNATFNKSFTVNIPSIVGGNTAYVGFTGGDWSLTATQDILNWTYVSGSTQILPQVGMPIFTPAGGTYTAAQTVTISDTTPGAMIYYTTGGSTPTTSSTRYSGGIMVSNTSTLKAMATAGGMSNSAVATTIETIQPSAVNLPQITTSALPSGAVAVAYSTTVTAASGVAPYTWSVTNGQLPPGLGVQASTGQISGTPSQAGTFSFSIQVKDSSSQTASAGISVNIAPASSPVITNLSPNSGPTTGTAVTITGSNFQAGAIVTFGGVAASSVTVSSSSQILAAAPSHIPGSVGVIVQASGQSSSSTANFTYNALAPTVSSSSPNDGPTAGGTKVTITGTNFLAGSIVLFGNASASSITVSSATQMQAVTPPNAAGLATVTVQNPGNLSANLASGFTYNASQSGPPTISSVSPTSGAPGTQVTIAGTNFTAADKVSFGNTNATPTVFVSATQLTAAVPSISAQTYSITVTDPDPSSVTLNNGFTVTAPPPSQSLLAGMTPGKYTLPSGWTLAAAQDFESGSLPSNQAINSGASIDCSFGHTGRCSESSSISYDSAADQWFFSQGQIKGSEVYLSYYDWAGGGAANEEYILSHFIKTGIGGANGMEEAGMPMVSNNKFNNTCPNIAFGPQGNFVISPWEFGTVCYFTNTWTQWEIWLRANTPGSSDGFIRIYKDGVTYADQENINIFGSVDMTGMQVEAGGWYTKNVWTSNGQFPNAGGTCTAAEGDGSEAGNWKGSFSTIGTMNCAPAPPIFNRYIDDIILLEK